MARRFPSFGSACFLPAAVVLVDGGPGSSFGLLLRNAATLIAFRNVVGFALLLIRVFRFVAAWHACLLLRCRDHNPVRSERFQWVGPVRRIEVRGAKTFGAASELCGMQSDLR